MKLKYFENSGISVIERNIRTYFRKKNTRNAAYINLVTPSLSFYLSLTVASSSFTAKS